VGQPLPAPPFPLGPLLRCRGRGGGVPLRQPAGDLPGHRHPGHRAGQCAEGSAAQRHKLGRPTTARLRKEAQAALDQDEAQADGDGVFRYHLFLTVTAPDEKTLTRQMLSARRRLIRARCQSIVLYGEQDQAFFASALPLARGLSPMRGVAGV